MVFSFVVEKFFQFDVLPFFLFCFPCPWSQSHKNITKTKVSEVTAYVFPRNFMLSGPTFKSLIHFELILVYGIK